MYKQLSAPLTAQVEVTTNCANLCVHCYNHWRHDHDAEQFSLSMDQATLLADKIAAARIFELVVTGGEPLLAPDATRTLVRRAGGHGLAVSLNSTLNQLTAPEAAWLKKHGLTSVLTSLHGPREIHDRIVHRAGAFDATLRGIALAREAGLPVHVNMVISRTNKDHVVETARLCQELGVSLFLATKAAQPENCPGFALHRLTREDISDYVRQVRQADLAIPVEMLSTFPLCGITDNADLALHGRRCLAGVAMLTIAADGQVRPCNHTDMAYGSIWTSDLLEIWERMREWRLGGFLPEACRLCAALMLCGGGCRMEAKTHAGSLTALDPYARPENLPRILPFLRQREQAPDNAPRAFSINPSRSRQESFGTVLCAIGGAPIMLSPEGAKVWRQFSTGRIYFGDDPGISWGNVNRQAFLAALERKKLISAR